MSKDGRNIRQRSRVQGAWGQPQGLTPGSSAPRRPWQQNNGQNQFQLQRLSSEVTTPPDSQFDLTLYGHGSKPRNSKHAENLEPKMPNNFSWVVDGQICAMGFPGQAKNILYLVKNNVRYLISLTAEREPPVDGFPDLTLINIKVVDFTPPSIEQIEQCLSIFEKAGQEGKAVGIHCNMGKGRTGTVLACYFVKFHNMDPIRAIQQVKRLRRWSVQTLEQENAVKIFDKHLHKT